MEDEKAEARREAARLMGSVKSPAKVAAALHASQFGGRKKGTTQSEETKAKISATRKAQEEARKTERAALGLAPAVVEKKKPGRPAKIKPDVETVPRPRGRPKKPDGQNTAISAGTSETGAGRQESA